MQYSGLQNCERICFCCFKPPRVWQFVTEASRLWYRRLHWILVLWNPFCFQYFHFFTRGKLKHIEVKWWWSHSWSERQLRLKTTCILKNRSTDFQWDQAFAPSPDETLGLQTQIRCEIYLWGAFRKHTALYQSPCSFFCTCCKKETRSSTYNMCQFFFLLYLAFQSRYPVYQKTV